MAIYNEKKSRFGYNKDSLSWSAFSKWKGSKEQYRMGYYFAERPSFQTAETMFGNHIGDKLENKHPDVDHIEQYSKPEQRILVTVGGVKLLGYLDSFDPKKNRFLEYKTGHKNKKGAHYWNAVKVAKHKQLDFYSLLIHKKFGKVQNQCKLIYMETEESVIIYKGRKLEPMHKGLRLTGEVKEFKRTIEQWERSAMQREILKVAKEIEKDYERFKRSNPETLQSDGQETPQDQPPF